jgi:hypothetical protein
MGLTAEDTYQKPGCPGRQTAQRLFKYWNQQHIEEYDTAQLNERQVIAKGRMKQVLSSLIFKLNYQLGLVENQVEGERKHHERHNENLSNEGRKDEIRPFKVSIGLESLRLKIMLAIKDVSDLNAAYEIEATAYEVLDETILNTLKQREELLRDKVTKFHINNAGRKKIKD